MTRQLDDVLIEKERSRLSVVERDAKLSALMQEVERLKIGFTSHIAELETKLKENGQVAQLEHELRQAL